MVKKTKTALFVLLFWTAFTTISQAQIKYVGKFEIGHLKYRHLLLNVDPGINWRGYNLDNKQSGLSISSINGIGLFDGKLNTGIGVGYLNFEGINGFSVFSDTEYAPLKTQLTPIFNLRFGFTHIWNQYDNGTGTGLIGFGLGLSYRLTDILSIYAKSGMALTQQSSFVPIQLGVKF
jgi:hypothetical protein